MEIIFHSPFSYDFFRMVSFPPMGHLERGYLPIWVKKLKLNGNAEPRDLLPPWGSPRFGVRFLHSAPTVEMTGVG